MAGGRGAKVIRDIPCAPATRLAETSIVFLWTEAFVLGGINAW